MTRVVRYWNNFWFEPQAPYALAVSRMVIAYCGLYFLIGGATTVRGLPVISLDRVNDIDFSSRYAVYAQNDPGTYLPASFLDWFGVPPPTQSVLTAAFAVALFACALLLVGLATRVSSLAAAGSLLYLIGMTNSWGKVNHGYHVLGLVLIVLAFSRSGDVWSVDAVLRRRLQGAGARPGPAAAASYTWPVRAMQLSFALMFFFAGWNKLITSGLQWAFSENMRNTLIYQNLLVRDWESASWIVKTAVAIDHPLLWYMLGAGGLFTELLFVGIVFFWSYRWVRRAFLLLGVGLVAGLDQLMQLPNPVLMGLLLLFVDWNGIRCWILSRREPAPQPRRLDDSHVPVGEPATA